MEQRYRKWSRLNGIMFVRADSPQTEGAGSGISQTPDSSNFCQYLEAIFHYRCNLGGDFYVRSSTVLIDLQSGLLKLSCVDRKYKIAHLQNFTKNR